MMHPQVKAMRDRRERNKAAQMYELSVEEARAADLADIEAASGGKEPVHEVSDLDVDGLPLRVFRPGPGELPVLVYFFGGGWTLGTIDTCDAVCRTLANLSGCIVVAAGYRLAPEHKFPAAVHDCEAAVRWAAGAFPGVPLAVGGDSAGGNLAAAVTLLTRDLSLAGQLLVYPNTDYQAPVEFDDPYLFNRTSVAWYWSQYLSLPSDGLDPLASPLRASDHSGLPPALVITAEFDPLCEQAEEYAHTLAKAGVEVTLTRYDGMIHGFFCMAGELEDGRRAQEQAATWMRTTLRGR